MANNVDLLHGSVYKGLIYFALPLLATSLIQLLFSTADMLFAGNLLGTDSAAAIGSSTMIVFFLINFLLGLSAGASVVISQYFGAKQPDKVKSAMQNGFIIAIVGGLILTLLSYVISPYVLVLTNVPANIMDMASAYIRIYSLSIVFTAVYDMGFSALRSVGNSQSPLIYLAIGGIVHLILNAVFLIVYDLGVEGLAWSTVLSQILIVILIFHNLLDKNPHNPVHLENLHFDSFYVKQILRIGLPVAIQATLITLSNIIIQSQINLFGDDIIAAFSVYLKIDNIVWLSTVAFGQAVMIFVGQNLGAHNVLRAKEGIRKCLIISVAVTLVASLLVLGFGRPLFGLFISDGVVIGFGMVIMTITMPLYFLYAVMEVLSGALKGAGKSFAAMSIIMMNMCVFRTIILIIVMIICPELWAVIMVYPITWILTIATLTMYYRAKPLTSALKRFNSAI